MGTGGASASRVPPCLEGSCGVEERKSGELFRKRMSAVVGFLSSLRLTVIVCAAAAFYCALATLGPDTWEWSTFEAFLIGVIGRTMLALRLNSPYESPVFLVICGLFVLNLLFCTLSALASGSGRRRGFRPALLLCHGGLLLFVVAALYGWRTRVEGELRIAAGEEGMLYEPRYYALRRRMKELEMRRDFLRTLSRRRMASAGDRRELERLERGLETLKDALEFMRRRPLYAVEVVKAWEEHYPGGGVKDWKALLRARRVASKGVAEGTGAGGAPLVAEGEIEVNVPFEVGGFTLYLYSFDYSTVLPGRRTLEVTLPLNGSSVRISGHGLDGMRLSVARVLSDFRVRRGADGKMEIYSGGGAWSNPAVLLKTEPPGGEAGERWLFVEFPDHDLAHGDEKQVSGPCFEVLDLQPPSKGSPGCVRLGVYVPRRVPVVGLGVVHGGAGALLWAGLMLMCAGLSWHTVRVVKGRE